MIPRAFRNTAIHLGSARNTEADWRSSISRAYYAAFLETREILRENVTRSLLWDAGRRVLREQETIIDLLKRSDQDAVSELGDLLGDLQSSRHDSDYDLRIPITHERVEDALIDLTTFLSSIDTVTPEVLARDVEERLKPSS